MDLKELSNEQLQELHDDYKQRVDLNHNGSTAIKELLNGGYGALSNQYNRWYSDDLAESITLTGQVAIQWVARKLNAFMNDILKTDDEDYVIAIDTDSVIVKVDAIKNLIFGDREPSEEERFEKMMKFSKKVENVIEEACEELYREMNVMEKSLHMKLEAVGSAVWMAKKRYAMSLLGFKGVMYTPRRLKIQGLEAIRSSTPQYCREAIKKAIPLIIEGKKEEIRKFLNEIEGEFNSLAFHQVAFPRTVNNLEKYEDSRNIYKSGCPIHVRAALVHNHYLKKNKLDNTYPLIRSGDNIRFSYMIMPNPTMENVFACPDEMPEEIPLQDFVDRRKQFQKTFYDPLQSMFEAAGIVISNYADITEFFE